MRDAVLISQLASGVFLLVGLVSGVWKYRHMITSEAAQAPVYVDICHRSELMYSFAAWCSPSSRRAACGRRRST
jgi:hypothetical protein